MKRNVSNSLEHCKPHPDLLFIKLFTYILKYVSIKIALQKFQWHLYSFEIQKSIQNLCFLNIFLFRPY